MKINENNIINDYESLMKKSIYNKTWKSKKLLMDIFNLDDLYFENYNKFFDIDFLNNYYNNFWNNYYNGAELVFNKYKDYYFNMVQNVMNYFKDMNFSYYLARRTNTYSDKETKELILDFFNNYSISKYKIVKDMFEEERIGMGNLEDFGGYCVCFNSNNKPYIMINGQENEFDLTSLTSLVHELGHAIESVYTLNRHKELWKVESMPFRELASEFFELEFLRYLQKNKIYPKEAINIICRYYDSLYEFLDDASFLNKNIIEDDKEYTAFDDRYYFSKSGVIRNFIDKDGKIVQMTFDFYDPLMYSIGSYLSLYLEKLKNEDEKYFQKVFDIYLSTRSLMSYENIFDLFQISKDDFLSGNGIKDIIKNDYSNYKRSLKLK